MLGKLSDMQWMKDDSVHQIREILMTYDGQAHRL